MRLICVVLSLILGLAVLSPGAAYGDSVPFWGAKASVAADTPIEKLKHGEWLWLGDVVTPGGLYMARFLSAETLSENAH